MAQRDKQQPTEPGWYWFSPPTIDGWLIGYVEYYGELNLDYQGKRTLISELHGYQWAGPLKEPPSARSGLVKPK